MGFERVETLGRKFRPSIPNGTTLFTILDRAQALDLILKHQLSTF
jgi:hypothetical protein